MPARQLWGSYVSASFRSNAIICSVMGLDFEYNFVDSLAGDTRKPEFLKLNPQHTVPVLVDEDGFNLNESKVISSYLVKKYDKTGKLYPKDDIKLQVHISLLKLPG